MPEFGSTTHLANIAGHALVGCGSALASGGECGPGALAAGLASAAAPAIAKAFPYARTDVGDRFGGTVASAVIGGVGSVAGGGKFANGAVTAAFGYLFNATLSAGWSAEFPALISRGIERAFGLESGTLPNGFGFGLVFQYPDPSVPAEADIPVDGGVYLQFPFEMAGKPSFKASSTWDFGTGSGTINGTFRGEATVASGIIVDYGASATFSSDGTLIGLGAKWGGGLGYSVSKTYTGTWTWRGGQ